MSIEIDVSCEDPRWQVAHLEELSERAILAVLNQIGLDGSGYEISVMGCNDERIAELNADFRGKNQPTNVLSWPAFDLPPVRAGRSVQLPATGADQPFTISLGDIAIAYETCLSEGKNEGKSFESHCLHLLVHGCLHLFGYDHIEDADAEIMEKCEVETLARLGVADPY